MVQQIEATLKELKQEQEQQIKQATIQRVQGLDRAILVSWSNDRRLTHMFLSPQLTIRFGWMSLLLLIVLMPASWLLALPHTPPAQFWTMCICWLLAVAVCLGTLAQALLLLDPHRRRQLEQQFAVELQQDEIRTLELAQMALAAQDDQHEREAQYDQLRKELLSDEMKQSYHDHFLRTGRMPTDQELGRMRKRYKKQRETRPEGIPGTMK